MNKNVTLEDYIEAGAALRLLKTVGSIAIKRLEKVLSVKDVDEYIALLNKLESKTFCKADSNMFNDFDLSYKYAEVFYGDTRNGVRSDVDKQVLEKAYELTLGLVNLESEDCALSHNTID